MTAPQPGQYGLVRTGGLAAWFIRFGTRSHVNHAILAIGDGQIVEATPSGAVIGTVDEYSSVVWSTIPLTAKQRAGICAAARSLLGTPYSWLDIATLAFACYGIRNRWIDKRIERTDRLICSALVDRAYMLAGVHLFDDGRLTSEVTPQDLLALVQP